MRPALRLLVPVPRLTDADDTAAELAQDLREDLTGGDPETDDEADDEADLADDLPLTVPVVRAGETPWPRSGTTTWVPAALLLAAAGECSCDACCADLARRKARRQLTAV